MIPCAPIHNYCTYRKKIAIDGSERQRSGFGVTHAVRHFGSSPTSEDRVGDGVTRHLNAHGH